MVKLLHKIIYIATCETWESFEEYIQNCPTPTMGF